MLMGRLHSRHDVAGYATHGMGLDPLGVNSLGPSPSPHFVSIQFSFTEELNPVESTAKLSSRVFNGTALFRTKSLSAVYRAGSSRYRQTDV